MIEDLVQKWYYKIKFRKFRKDMNEYRLALNKYGSGSEVEVAYSMWLLKRHDNALGFIKAARRVYEEKRDE